ncbi:MAG: HDOD domain-containing protein [Betaproteobacteria bacterium]|nr:HDOD domain-containing protein [Betaproteobacteria bacterium]
MQESPALGQVILGYSPVTNRERAVVATRLTVFPERPDASPDAAELLAVLDEVWPAESATSQPLRLAPRPLDPATVAQRAGPRPQLLLNLAGEGLLRAAMEAAPGPQLMIEVPAFMVGHAANRPLLERLHGAGSVLLIKGRPLAPLPPELLELFSHSIVDVAEDRRSGPAAVGFTRTITTVQAGCRTTADFDAAFQRGAVAVLGWPLDDAAPGPSGRASVPSDVNAVMALINGVEQERPVAELEAVLKRDPTLAFRLMRYLNSPAFGLTVEINSFGHALMLLGYQRLKRWLALLLVSSAKGANARPLMHATVRRGMLLEELAREQGDAEMRGELFICGVFSLLDQLLQQPFAELLPNMPVPERVQQALRGEGGPYLPYLELVKAIEQEAVFDIRERAEALMLGMATVNRAVLMALRAARKLDG